MPHGSDNFIAAFALAFALAGDGVVEGVVVVFGGGHKFKAKPELRRRVIALELQEVRRRPQVPKPELRRGTIALELQKVRRRPQVPHVVECPKMAAFLESLPRHRLRYCICLPANWPDGTRFA